MTPLIPYSFARAHQLLVQRADDGVQVLISQTSSLSGLTEVQRILVTVTVHMESDQTLREAISKAYSPY